jgi:hypothetical protein
MKKNFFCSFLLLFVFTSFNAKAQTSCPPGYSAVVSYSFDQFNFHKPRTDCKKGFGLCIRGHWEKKCKPNNSFYARIIDNQVEFWAEIKNNKLELHLPVELKQQEGFIGEDMTVFFVEDDTFEIKNEEGEVIAKLKEGEYAVEENETDLIIKIDLIEF